MNRKGRPEYSRAFARQVGVAALLLLGASATFAPQASAQSYPARPVRIVVPAAPGGGLDLVARIVAQKLTEAWPHPTVVENRPGANFIVGTDMVAKAAPDGYTLIIAPSVAFSINPSVFPDLPYRPERDFAPVSLLTNNPFILLVNNAVPANNVQEFITHLKANPGKLNHASNSASTMLISELFKSVSNVEYADINYKGGVLAAAATAAGETQFCFVDLGSATAPMKGGRVRGLAVTTTQRYKLRSDIPTLSEAGVQGAAAAAWVVMAAPARTPAEIVAKINADAARGLAAPDVAPRMESLGSEIVASSVAEAADALRTDTEKWAKLVRERNIKFQR